MLTSPTFLRLTVLAPAAQTALPRLLRTLGGLVVDTPGPQTSPPAQPNTPGVSASMTVLDLTLGMFIIDLPDLRHLIWHIF